MQKKPNALHDTLKKFVLVTSKVVYLQMRRQIIVVLMFFAHIKAVGSFFNETGDVT